MKVLWAFLLGSIFLTQTVSAQDFCVVSGKVTDRSISSPIAGVVITILPDGYTAITDNAGRYRATRIAPGMITIQVESAFHRGVQVGPVLLREGEVRQFDIALQPIILKLPPHHVKGEIDKPVGVALYEHMQIEESNCADLGQFLDRQGYHIHSDGRSKYITLRGFSPAGVLVLLDGHPINPDGAAADLATIPSETVERVEVYTSGGAARYGANALGGAVNIISRRAGHHHLPGCKLTATTGSYSLKRGTVNLSPHVRKYIDILLNYEYAQQRNDYSYQHPYEGELERQNNFKRFYSGYLSLQSRNIRGMTFTARIYNNHNGVPGAVLQENKGAAFAKRENRIFTLGYKWRSIDIAANYRELEQGFRDHDGFIPYDKKYLQVGRQLSATWRQNLSKLIHLAAGSEYSSENFFNDDLLKPKKSLPRVSRETESLFGSARFTQHFNPFSFGLEGRYRFDRIEDSTFTSPYAGLSLNWTGIIELELEAAYSESYRYPPIDALFWCEDVFAIGNPDLSPETAITREGGFNFRYECGFIVQGRHIWFGSDLSNLIVWRRRFDGKYKPVNIDRSDYSGRELAISLTTSDNLATVGYNRTTLTAINKSDNSGYLDKVIPFRPDRTERFFLTFQYRRAKLNYSYSFTGERFIREANTKQQSCYSLHDLIVEFRLSVLAGNQTLTISAFNFTDQKYELLERVPMPPRTVSVGLTIEF